jgi:hypothetical protein
LQDEQDYRVQPDIFNLWSIILRTI